MDRMELALGRLLQVGVLLCLVMVFFGGIFYLYSHGTHSVDYQIFHAEPASLQSLTGIFQGAFSSSLGLIQVGLLFLVILQLLRVALTAFYFILMRDLLFVGISGFILGVLLYSLFKSF